MAAKKRVGFTQSFRLATRSAWRGGSDDAMPLFSVLFGLWWWIAGVPEDVLRDYGDGERES